jgi:thiol-disulfide isomerase/thioredoxin
VTDRRIAASSPASLPTSTSPKSGDAFIVHETPQPVPALSFIDSDGNRPSLAAFRGRTILLNIWATWCLPCREEMPALERLEAKLSGPEFEVVPLSIDRGGLPKVKSFYEEISLKALGMFVDTSSKASYALGAVGIPTALLINPDGLEVGRLVGPAEWDSPELTEIIQQQLQRAARKTGHD